MDYHIDYYAKYIKYKTKYIQLKKIQKASGHGSCKLCNCGGFNAENFNQLCKCTHSYKEHNRTISDRRIISYNQLKKYFMKSDYCNLNSCKYYEICKCDKFVDNLKDDKCKSCGHNVLNHCKTYNDIY